jgi:probable DNA metabolism protein
MLTFAQWRDQARSYLQRNIRPGSFSGRFVEDGQTLLFNDVCTAGNPSAKVKLPKAFLDLAQIVALHRDPKRWDLLYRVAWRVQNENRNLLRIEVDDDVRALELMRKAISRDIHKMRAFVRFRRVMDGDQEQFIAWYPPDHHILQANERFFVERFGSMRWAILTPDATLVWNLQKAEYGPGVPRSSAPAEDELEELWRTYYKSIYNPARRNLDAMRAELPVRRWVDLPESRTIAELVRTSEEQVETMIAKNPISATAFIPLDASLTQLRQAVKKCRACELCALATQPVFGEGPGGARVLLVGEQPGNDEDLAGQPFVGPAGRILTAAMEEAGLGRTDVYLTNAVKAFRFEERGKRRIHKKPAAGHIAACRPWLEAEIAKVNPRRIVCLGASAAQSVLGRAVQVQEERGRVLKHHLGADVVVTYHPSAILRALDGHAKAQMTQALVDDLKLVVG